MKPVKSTAAFVLFIFLFVIRNCIYSQEIIFITDDENDNEQISFLESNGYTVTKFFPSRGLASEPKSVIGWLNSKELVIIGRSPSIGQFMDLDKQAWNNLNVPILLTSPWIAADTALNWFNSSDVYHMNLYPDTAYARIPDIRDTVFSNIVFQNDSLDWCLVPHDFIKVVEPSNAQVLAWNNNAPLIARFSTNKEFYTGSGDYPAAPRTYFGFGNDNTGVINYFPLTGTGRQVFLAEIKRMIDLPKTGRIDDTRDAKKYFTVKIGNKWWMSQNLNHGTRINGNVSQTNNGTVDKYCYNNLESNCDTLGALYQWDEMMDYRYISDNQGICPKGWHVPDDSEWKELEISLGMSSGDADLNGWRGTDQGTKLKKGGSSGFNAGLDGYMTTANNFINYGTGNCFWTGTDIYARYLINSRADVYRWNTPLKSYGLSLRCIMDDPFTANTLGLPQMYSSITKWGDYDNDGDMDLFFCGHTSGSSGFSDIYRNDANGTSFTALGISLERVSGSADWADFDCDGDVDLLFAGYYTSGYITRLYRNDGSGVFTNYSISMPGGSVVKWGDYDNDGDPDILIFLHESGEIALYENKGTGTYQRSGIYFEKVVTDFISLVSCDFDWGDYNNDGLPDIVVSGKDGITNEYCKIYKNNGNKTFTDLGLLIKGAEHGRVNWGDFDNDNDLDILLTGSYKNLRLYRNEGNDIFSNYNAGLVDQQAINTWFDFNNDGNLDVLLAGYTNSRIYTGDGKGSYEYIQYSIANGGLSDIDIADYDNDNDLDFAYSGHIGSTPYTRVYKNNTGIVNQAPQVPSGLTAKQVGADVIFSWDPAHDDENGTNLSYNITAGTSSGNCLIVSPMSNLTNGKRLKLNKGNVGLDTTWVLKNAPLGMLYWSVQSIDKTLKSSIFAPFQSIEVKPPFLEISLGVDPSDYIFAGNSLIDINNDGLLDILSSGSYTFGMIPSKEAHFYINQGNNTFTQSYLPASLVGNFFPCNLNNDNYMDAIFYGEDYIPTGIGHDYDIIDKTYSLINNRSGGFNVSTTQFAGIITKNIASGDIDNDGDADIVLIGSKSDTSGIFIVRKDSVGFTVNKLGYEFNSYDQAISSVDLDNDLDLDIVYGRYILLNDSVFIKTTVFPFNNVISMDWADFDGDGDLDPVIFGMDTISNYSTLIYRNNGNLDFSPLKNKIQAFAGNGMVRWLDYNNDGLYDLTASDDGSLYIYIYQGDGSFKLTTFSGYGVYDWGDINNDGEIDFMGDYRFYISNGNWGNTSPVLPANLDYKLDKFDIILSWDPSVDFENNKGLTYNLKIGDTKDTFNIMPVLTSEEGRYRVMKQGNAQTNHSWRLKNLPLGRYYWKVQAVDQSYMGGTWSDIDSFVINKISPDFSYKTPVCKGQSLQFTDLSSTTDSIVSWKWDFGDGNMSDLQNPVHIFENADTFNVSLWAFTLSKDSTENIKQVIVNPAPVASFSVDPVCIGQVSMLKNLSDTSTIAVDEWTWNFGKGPNSDIQGDVENDYTKTDTASLYIKATNGCEDIDSQVVVVGEYPDATIQVTGGSLNRTFCEGDSSVLSVNKFNTFYQYIWKSYNLPLNNNQVSKLSVKKSGNYSLTAINPSGGCIDNSDSYQYTVVPRPSVPQLNFTNDTSLCPDDNFSLSVTNVKTGFSYMWLKNGDEMEKLNQTSLNGHIDPGIYKVKVYINECKAYSEDVQISLKSAPDRPKILVNSGPELFIMSCDNLQAKSYQWYINGQIIPEANRNYYIVGREEAAYCVEIKAPGKDCPIRSRELLIPSLVTGSEEISKKESETINIIPNPNNGTFKIQIQSSGTHIQRISLSDISGKIVYLSEITDLQKEFIVETIYLSNGIYLLEAETNKGYFYEKIVIKK